MIAGVRIFITLASLPVITFFMNYLSRSFTTFVMRLASSWRLMPPLGSAKEWRPLGCLISSIFILNNSSKPVSPIVTHEPNLKLDHFYSGRMRQHNPRQAPPVN